jgi:hypothetical protein
MAVRAQEADIGELRRLARLKFAYWNQVMALDDPLDAPGHVGVEAASLTSQRPRQPLYLRALAAGQVRIPLALAVGDEADGGLVGLVLVLGSCTAAADGREGLADLSL